MKRRKPWRLLGFGAFCALLGLFALHPDRFPGGTDLALKLRGKSTIGDRLGEVGPSARQRVKSAFDKAHLAYPPAKLLLVGLKAERRLQIYAPDEAGQWQFVRFYDVLGASGHSGPKLREGDLQVPEGFYKIEALNPNSAFHLALRVNYPNEFDREQAKLEGRTDLGRDIMIHGSNASVGCLAMGDTAAEDLFVLAADTGLEKIEVILSPGDFRKGDIKRTANQPAWTQKLYKEIKTALVALPSAE
jgi:hypothetical protein